MVCLKFIIVTFPMVQYFFNFRTLTHYKVTQYMYNSTQMLNITDNMGTDSRSIFDIILLQTLLNSMKTEQ